MTAETTQATAPSDTLRAIPGAVVAAPHVVEPPSADPPQASNLAGWAMGTAVAALILAAASPVWVPLLRSDTAATPAPLVDAAPMAEQIAPLANRVEALEATVQRLAAANAAAPASRSAEIRVLALAGAVAQLRMAAARPTPFAVELAVVTGLADGRAEFVPPLRALAAHAAAGIPTARQLRARFPDWAAAALMADAGTDDVPLAAQLVTWFASTVPFGMGGLIHDLTLPATAAGLREAEARMADDLPGALAALATLPDAPAAAMQPWIALVRARLDVDRAIDLLVRTALAELPAAAR